MRPFAPDDPALLVAEVSFGQINQALDGCVSRSGSDLVWGGSSDGCVGNRTPVIITAPRLRFGGGQGVSPPIGSGPFRCPIVRNVTATDVREICQVRRALECEAIREACGRIELAKLQELAATFRELQAARRPSQRFLARARHADSQLHDLVADASCNRFLAEQIGRLKLLFRAFRDVAWKYEKDHLRIVSEAGEHLAIIEALLAGDAKAASRVMAQHIRSGSKYWSRLFSAS
jgi:hypothetical protein